MSVSPLSGLLGLSFDCTLLSPVSFVFRVRLLFLSQIDSVGLSSVVERERGKTQDAKVYLIGLRPSQKVEQTFTKYTMMKYKQENTGNVEL